MKNISRQLNLFLFISIMDVLLFPCIINAQTFDTRTYAEISSNRKKNVIDYFLLCPDIYFTKGGEYSPAHLVVSNPKRDRNTLSEEEIANSVKFRKGLLKLEQLNEGITIQKCIKDINNGYIKITGSDIISKYFEIVFTLFEQPGKVIPALTYHHEATEEIIDNWVFYNIYNNNWTPIKETNFLPSYSLHDFKSVISEESAESIPLFRINWKLELPRYGTTLKIIPMIYLMECSPEESNKYEALYQQFENYVLESSWHLESGIFGDPVMTLYDKTLLPKSGNISAFSAFVILPSTAFNNLTATIPVNVRKDLLNKKKVVTEGLIYEVIKAGLDYFEIKCSTKSPVPSDEVVKIAFMGTSKDSDIFAVSVNNEQSQDFKIWTITRDNGAASQTQIYPFPVKTDFYKTGSNIGSENPSLYFTIEEKSVKIEWNTWTSHEEAEPDYFLLYTWKGNSWDVIKTAKRK
jgi:hypothetical protein